MARESDASIVSRKPRVEVRTATGQIAVVSYPLDVYHLRELRRQAEGMGGELVMKFKGANRDPLTDKQRRSNHAIFSHGENAQRTRWRSDGGKP